LSQTAVDAFQAAHPNCRIPILMGRRERRRQVSGISRADAPDEIPAICLVLATHAPAQAQIRDWEILTITS